MIANLLKRLRPPPPAAATCPARARVPSPAAPCPAPGVGPGCAAAASRRDGHLGQTELFIQFTSLKLQELRGAAARPHRAHPRGCGQGRCLGTLCTPWAPCRGGWAAWHGGCCQAGAQAGTCARAHAPVTAAPTAACRRRREVRVPRGRGGTTALPGEVCALAPRAVQGRMRVHACACVCGPAWPHRPCQGQAGAGGSVPEGAWPTGTRTPNATHLGGHALAMSLPRQGGLCGPRCPGWGVPPSAEMGGPCLESVRLLPVTSTTVSTATLKAYSCRLTNEPALVAFPGDAEPPSPCPSPWPRTTAPSAPTPSPLDGT